MGQRRALAGVALISVVATSAAWYGGSRITSPDEARSKARPPKASLITAPVERRQLSANVVLRGDLVYDEATPLVLPGTSEAKAVVTKDPPAEGTELADGQVLTEVNGRPVFVLQGELPAYRTLGPGVQGDDVAQLEVALQRRGFDPGPADGVFDGATQGAISAFYLAAGYTTKAPAKEDRDAATEAEAALEAARRSQREAAQAAAAAARPIPTSQRLQLESAVASAQASVDSANLAAVHAAKQADAQIAAIGNELAQAQAAKRQADAAYDAATAPGAVDPDTGAPFTRQQLTEMSNAGLTASSTIAAKMTELDAARSAKTAELTDKFAAIGEAQRSLRIAQAAWLEGLTAKPDASTAAAVADAQRAVGAAERRHAEAQAGVGVTIPLGELVFVRTLPRRIDQVTLHRGDTASGKVVTISGADLRIRTAVVPADRPLLSVGQQVVIDEEQLDLHFDGVVAQIADRPGADGVASGNGSGGGGGADGGGDGDGGDTAAAGNGSGGSGSGGGGSDTYQVVIGPGALPEGTDVSTLAGVNFKITVPVKSTSGDVLAVPLAALSATADGGAQVEVEDRPGSTRFVRVQKGLAAQGFVEVRPATGERGSLDAGDQVVVGR